VKDHFEPRWHDGGWEATASGDSRRLPDAEWPSFLGPDGLLVRVVGMVMMMVVVVWVRVFDHHDLRHCNRGHCEAEK